MNPSCMFAASHLTPRALPRISALCVVWKHKCNYQRC